MQQIIGGLFALEDVLARDARVPFFLEERPFLLVNARSGLHLLVAARKPANVWLPSFLCDSMLAALERTPTRIRFYAVDGELRVARREWLEEVRRGDLVVLIDYFGFPCDGDLAAAARGRGAFVLEDACQALLSRGVGEQADGVLYSPRKFLGVPDGGLLVLRRRHLDPDPIFAPPPDSWWQKAHGAALGRRYFDHTGGDHAWHQLFRAAEREAPIGPYGMSSLAREILLRYGQYEEAAQRRVENYRCLAEHLGAIALRADLPEGVVPLGFAVRVPARDELRRACFQADIYPPVHWPIAGLVPAAFEESHLLAEQILTLPCDQRYGRAEMERMATLVLDFLG